MRNLAKFIDRIIKLYPSLKSDLVPIKTKYSRFPYKENDYWTEFISLMNSSRVTGEQRDIIRKIFVRKQPTKKKYTFEAVKDNETVIGVIPEYISDQLRSLDRAVIDMTKLSVEANMTHDSDMLIGLRKKSSIIEIKQKKIWKELRDEFKLWDFIDNLSIRIKNNLLVLVKQKNSDVALQTRRFPNVSSSIELINSDSGPLLKMSPDVMKVVFQFLGINPPPGLFDEQ